MTVKEKILEITFDWLKENSACSEGVEWFKNQKEKDGNKLVIDLFESDHFEWSNWLIVRLMDKPQKVQYAIFAAKKVIDIFEEKYPEDKRPRKAIEAAQYWLENQNASAASAAASAASDAWDAWAASDAWDAWAASAASAASAAASAASDAWARQCRQ